MQKVIDYIISLLGQFPAWFQIIISFLIIAILIFLNGNAKNTLINKASVLLKKAGGNTPKKHDLFQKKAIYLNEIKQSEFDCEEKNKIFHIIMHSYISASVSTIDNFVSSKKRWEKLSGQQIISELNSIVHKISDNYNNARLKALSFEYSNTKALEIINLIDRKGLRKWNLELQTDLFKRIVFIISKNKACDTNIEKINCFITEVDYQINEVLEHSFKIFKTINGEIKNIINN